MASARRSPEIFWGEMHPCEHFVQIYGNDDIFLDSLASFVAAGMRADREAAIILATQPHLDGLDERLRASGIDVDAARHRGLYVSRAADDLLPEIVVNGWPDRERFEGVIGGLIDQARAAAGGRVRAFGELVAILWSRGLYTATLELERLWSSMCEKKAFRLYCAYPKHALTKNPTESIREIHATHSLVLPEAGVAAAD